jgi:aminoglycoside phosphotransferase (APT) family kinase protein
MPAIDESLIQALIRDQFPQWAHLPVHAIPRSGWDNRTFRVGDHLLARLPSAQGYAAQVHREQRWLPYLRSHLPLDIPAPVGLGRPAHGYPWAWSVYTWIPGASAADQAPVDVGQFVERLSDFLTVLHTIPADAGLTASADNFFRGGSVKVYDGQFRQAIAILGSRIDSLAALNLWESATASHWTQPPVWVHGDIALGNLILSEDSLVAVIDFGQMCVGDPACDLAIAWTYLRGKHRKDFRSRLAVDAATWHRAKAWALWKAAIVAAKLVDSNAVEAQTCWETIHEVMNDAAELGW